MGHRHDQSGRVGPLKLNVVRWAFVLLGCWMSGAALAGRDDVQRLRELGEVMPLEMIIKKALKRQPGRVIAAELEEYRHRLVYEVEILDDHARVWGLLFDVKTGEFLEREEEIKR